MLPVSKITAEHLATYIRIDSIDDNDTKELEQLRDVAISFVKGFTGLKTLDNVEEFYIVICVLVQDMYDNRTLYVDKTNLNKVVESILYMHSENYL